MSFPNLSLRRLAIVATVVPLIFVAAYSYVLLVPARDLLDSVWGFPAIIAAAGLAIAAFSALMFGAIGRLQRDVERLSRVASRQNTQLRALNEASLVLAQEMEPAAVLQRVADLSRELVQARYAALSVADDHGDARPHPVRRRVVRTRGRYRRTETAHGEPVSPAHPIQPERARRVDAHEHEVGRAVPVHVAERCPARSRRAREDRAFVQREYGHGLRGGAEAPQGVALAVARAGVLAVRLRVHVPVRREELEPRIAVEVGDYGDYGPARLCGGEVGVEQREQREGHWEDGGQARGAGRVHFESASRICASVSSNVCKRSV